METIKDIIKDREIYTVESGSSVRAVVNYMAEKGVGLVPVMKEGKLVGVFSERDLVKRVIAKDKDLNSTLVDEVMSTKLIIAKSEETIEQAMAKMKEAHIRHIIVVSDDKLTGVLSLRDLLEVDLNQCKTTVEVLHNYIYSK